MAIEAPNTTGPFIAVIFILILLPFSFAVYSFYNSRTDRRLRREDRIRAQAAANLELARPVLWEAWTKPVGKSYDAPGSWNSIQVGLPSPVEPIFRFLLSNSSSGLAFEASAYGCTEFDIFSLSGPREMG
jgi:hypothetical protein